MIIPSNERCRVILDELADEPNLTEWEYEFITSNSTRTHFTDSQKAVIARLDEKYEV